MAPTGSTGRGSSMATLTSFSDRKPTPRRRPRPEPPAPEAGASVGGGSRSMAAAAALRGEKRGEVDPTAGGAGAGAPGT